MRYGLLLIVFFLVMTGLAHAKLVHYMDEEGIIHYVNTDYAQVPLEYRWQVKEPPANETGEAVDNLPANAEISVAPEASPEPQPQIVELFIRRDCDRCRLLELKLKGGLIPYVAYDVDIHPIGRQVYEEQGGDLPFVRFGKTIIRDNPMYWIQNYLRKSKTPPSTQNP